MATAVDSSITFQAMGREKGKQERAFFLLKDKTLKLLYHFHPYPIVQNQDTWSHVPASGGKG